MANSQHRCVFVGNIPYDATEEQIQQICEEVGPVVSFRLVIDRETGKPKGYGFCEYKDEETALSARRNLNGYDINGRQLRVDFAENDKNNDKSREHGRSGPGLSTTPASQKQTGGPTVQGDPSLHQPIGLQVAMAAAVVMAGTQNSLPGQPILGTDPLTLHLAKIPKGQLIDVLTEVKGMATQNKEQARQLLLVHPHLSKAVLQAHIMLKTVSPHMLQMPNAQLLSVPPAQPFSIQPLSGLPHFAQNKVQPGFIPHTQNQPSSAHPAALVPNPYAAPLLPPQARLQTPLPPQHQGLQPQPNASLLNRVENHMATPSPLLQYSGQNGVAGPVQPCIPNHKPSSSFVSAIPNNGNKDHINPQNLLHNPAFDHHPNIDLRLNDKDQISRSSKLLKMNGGMSTVYSPVDVNLSASVLGSSQVVSSTGNQILKTGPLDSQKQNHELHAGIDSALLQQVLNLSPEQLSSLPPEQQQQVIQLQQMLRKST